MTVSVGTIKHVYNGNNTTRNWDYIFPIATTDGSDIKLYKTAIGGAITEITSNYSVSVVNKYVTYPTIASGLPLLATGEKITLLRVEPLSQASDWVNQGPFNAETVEAALDKATMIAQQQDEKLSRAIKYPVDEIPTTDDPAGFIGIMEASAAAAAASEAAAANYAAALKATSTSSVAIGTGEKTFTTQSGKQFAAGQFILIVDVANSANYMHGRITSYSGPTLVVDVQSIGGSGTKTSWNIYVSGTRGAIGAAGSSTFAIAIAGGTADAITADYTPDVELADLTLVAFVATAANATTTPTFAPDGLTAHIITKKGGEALLAGDIAGAGFVVIVEYNLANTRWELLNPAITLDTDGTLAANSDTRVASQKATKGYVDTKVPVPLTTAKGGTGSTADANAANGVVVLDVATKLPAVDGSQVTGVLSTPPDGSISQAKLKTATGEVSAYNGYGQYTLPGGEYGFYPQIKSTVYGGYTVWRAFIWTAFDEYGLPYGTPPDITDYATHISMGCKSGSTGTIYARQRYVTASGEDMWIFLLLDKITKEIISAYQAPDHPAYGNGGDFDKTPHPFNSYDETKHEIVLLDKETCFALKQESEQIGKSMLTLINEEYKSGVVDQAYQPLHSGKFLTEDKEGKRVQVEQMVQNIPIYIKVRKLEKLTQEDKDAKEVIRQQKALEAEEERRIEELIEAKKRELAIIELKKEGKIT